MTSQPRAGVVRESLQETDCPPPEAKLPEAVPPVIEKSTMVASDAPGMTTLSPGSASTVVSVSVTVLASTVWVVVDDTSTANATAKAAAITSADAPNFRT